nr:CBS domain-containing protein [Microvirga mediterraneensis]
MTTPVISVEPSTSIGEAAKLMLAHRISGLPVVERNGRLVGVVSEGDLLRRSELGTECRRPSWLEFLVGPGRIADEFVHAHGRKVEEVMSADLVTVQSDATLDDVVEAMSRRHIKRLPVIKGDSLIGIVTRSDIMRALAQALPPASAQEMMNDEQIRNAIVAELASQDWGGSFIRVNVLNGAVELIGSIFDERERRAAHVIAENVPGVKSVKDQLVWIEPVSGMVILPPDDSPR